MNQFVEEKGMATFLDVFRRADKNDDNALSLEEFKSFFADGIVSKRELEALFHKIDRDNTNNLDTKELCDYFSKHLGPFKGIFAGLEDISESVTKTLKKTSEDYSNSSFENQFISRFLLKEVLSQLETLTNLLQTANDHCCEEKLKDKDSENNSEAAYIPTMRSGLSAKRQLKKSMFSHQHSTEFTDMGYQVQRLQELVNKLENKIQIHPIDEEVIEETESKIMAQIVCRKHQVREEYLKKYKSALRNYTEAVSATEDCLRVTVSTYIRANQYVLYEIWQSSESYCSFWHSPESKSFQHNIIDTLENPETLQTFKIPGSWLEI